MRNLSSTLLLGLWVAAQGCVGTIDGPLPGDEKDDGGTTHPTVDTGTGIPGDTRAPPTDTDGTPPTDSGTPSPSEDTSSPTADTGPQPDTTVGPDTTPPPDTKPPTDTKPPPDTTPPPDTGDPLESARQTCVDEINRYRATLGLKAYARDPADEKCADGQAQADSVSGVAHSAFGKCSEFAQNECPGWPGPAGTLIVGCLKMMWDEGPGADFHAHGHYINMSSTSYTKVSCGFFQKTDGSGWAVQDFR